MKTSYNIRRDQNQYIDIYTNLDIIDTNEPKYVIKHVINEVVKRAISNNKKTINIQKLKQSIMIHLSYNNLPLNIDIEYFNIILDNDNIFYDDYKTLIIKQY